MRILLSLALLLVVLVGAAIFGYYYRKPLMVWFGIAPSASKGATLGLEEQGRALPVEMGMQRLGSDNSAMRSGGKPPPVGRQVSDNSGSSNRRGNPDLAPMIVVAADDGHRGSSLPYDAVAAACGHWAESRKIGSGGAATVYLAELPRYGSVAVKRFHPKEGSGRAWTRELEALCQCRHPHILEIIGHADEGPENLIIMPYMEGGTLSEALPRMWWANRVAVVGQVVRALSFLHGKQIVHRDVKSSNILLDASLRHARLADFGLAKDQVKRAGAQSCHGTTGIVVGSPGYMAPELMMRPATEKTDAYSLGVVLLEALTGLPAWDADESGTVLTDRAVVDGTFQANLVDPAGSWPADEIAVCSSQAIELTLFDPGRRKTVATMEQDPKYVQHLERATKLDAERCASAALQKAQS